MFRYEILILTIPEITKDEASTLEFQVNKLIKGVEGTMISFERWGKYRLAYPVRKNDYGVYFLIRFEAEEKHSISKEINTLFSVKFSDIVMRKHVAKLGQDQSLEYQKPPSLEDTPRRHISSFLEEKGLLKSKRNKPDTDKPADTSSVKESTVEEKPEKKAEESEKTTAPVDAKSDTESKTEAKKVEVPTDDKKVVEDASETKITVELDKDVAKTTKEV